MRWLKVLMPRRVGDLIPAGGYVPDKALTAERDAVRQTAMLNLAISMALVYVGALVGQTMDMASYRDAAYTAMITGLDTFLN